MIFANTSKTRVIDTFGSHYNNISVESQLSEDRWISRLWFIGILSVTIVVGLIMFRSGPSVSFLGWIMFFVGAVVIVLQPRYGIYLVLFLTLVGDFRLLPWFPFIKNFSSRESLLYLHDAVIISPLEVYFGLIFASWLGRSAMLRKINLYFSPLFWFTFVFGLSIVFGLGYGILRGGYLNIALWESRAIFYLPVMMLLTSNLLEKRGHFSNLMWFTMGALFIEAIAGCYFYFVVLNSDLSGVIQIAAHAAAIHANTFFIYLISVWIFHASWTKRLILPLMIPFFLITYIAMQRRAGFITLAVAIIVIAIILFKDNRKVFFMVVPVLGFAGLAYTAVFWNSSGALGVPAQAIKSVVAPDQASAEDQSSDLYRLIENYDASFNIHSSPLVGIGFGKKINFVIPLPDISDNFVFWEYIIHNSIAWIWIKTGIIGFFLLLFLIGASIMAGVQAIARIHNPDLKAIVFTATAYVIMHFIYAYVDMSWDVESMVYLGAMIGVIGCVEHIAQKPIPIKANRWLWQPILESSLDLLPIPGAE